MLYEWIGLPSSDIITFWWASVWQWARRSALVFSVIAQYEQVISCELLPLLLLVVGVVGVVELAFELLVVEVSDAAAVVISVKAVGVETVVDVVVVSDVSSLLLKTSWFWNWLSSWPSTTFPLSVTNAATSGIVIAMSVLLTVVLALLLLLMLVDVVVAVDVLILLLLLLLDWSWNWFGWFGGACGSYWTSFRPRSWIMVHGHKFCMHLCHYFYWMNGKKCILLDYFSM